MKFNLDKKGYNAAEVDRYLTHIAAEYNRMLEAQRARIDMLRDELAATEIKLKEHKDKTALITKAIYNAVDKAAEIENLAKEKYIIEIERLKAFHEKWEDYYYRILESYPLDNDLIAAGAFNQKVRKILANTNLHSDTDGEKEAKIPIALEETYEQETKRLEDKRIGYISIQTEKGDGGSNNGSASSKDDDTATLLKMLPNADLSSPILSGDPVARIKQYLLKAARQEVAGKKKNTASNKKTKSNSATTDNETASTTNHTSSGFSFEEALNPTDDLETIMRDLGLLDL